MFRLLAWILLLTTPVLAHAGVDDLLQLKAGRENPSGQIEAVSAGFLGRKYQANTLGGGPGQPEALTVNLEGVDCFTLLDYVEAIRRAAGPDEFRSRLRDVRYQNADISWSARKHFFTDWSEDKLLDDMTAAIGEGAVVLVDKVLNRKASGDLYLQGVPLRKRVVTYLPTKALEPAILSRLHTGDYLGIYSASEGLDVSHVGILIRRDADYFLRHASSRSETLKVIDEPLMPYLEDKPGIVVLRARRQ